MRTIQIVNQSTVVDPKDFQDAVAACQIQLTRDFAPAWSGLSAKLVAVQGKPDAPVHPLVETIYVLDNSDQVDALGYHEVETGDVPVGFVFAKTTQEDGSAWQVTLSHELLEQLADPFIQTTAAVTYRGKPAVVGYEICLAEETAIIRPGHAAISIRELAEAGTPFKVLSADDHGNVVEAFATAARKTGAQRAVVAVRLDNGDVVRCTPEHRFLLPDGQYRMAKNLQPGDRLFSGNVLPTSAGADSPDLVAANSVLRRQNGRRLVACPNGENVCDGELASPAFLAAHSAVAGHSALAGRVDSVGLLSTDEEMPRPNARRRVAAMANAEASGNRPDAPFVSDSMGEVNTPLESDLTIPGAIAGAYPEPATVGLLDLCPEPFGDCRCPGVVGGMPGVQPAVPAQSCPMGSTEALGADRAAAFGDGAFINHANIVDSVEPDGYSDVYDITVPGLHNFAVEGGIFVHNCDPVENDSYSINGVPVSNFVTPAWFQDAAGAKGPFDFLKKLAAPLTMTGGGYVAFAVARLHWQQDVAGQKSHDRAHYRERVRRSA